MEIMINGQTLEEYEADFEVWCRQYQRRFQKIQVVLDDPGTIQDPTRMTPLGLAYLAKIKAVLHSFRTILLGAARVPIEALNNGELRGVLDRNTQRFNRQGATDDGQDTGTTQGT